ncbi:hypothetical protein [Streptomyces sp. AcE210]|uniref:hypothetical protein n=1 Tax=Streptomyces sp. AcE210 TaxID=2292703 RepID=UPI000E305995|nr:hypothetical protein [Streptomyces sp. AcE210]RFC78081.1 hypothetical protein DXZ75_09945 [Streptomyces sp. AcE210]
MRLALKRPRTSFRLDADPTHLDEERHVHVRRGLFIPQETARLTAEVTEAFQEVYGGIGTAVSEEGGS